ncbi:MFS transporter [Marinobacter zhejiangensis]|uniref:Predicted arabinose efflux permease, MFS family n=1 Tax=Marinobacter zhejiangensis TaxID=488535 RepID=A0A1I4QUH8_9GAMM|nr:MFS transporter [Marinobacter zhejiangensis]SFM43363.1 Predicted arabinose efflux permease, MFS family [Marinobacter zhejiangensis]
MRPLYELWDIAPGLSLKEHSPRPHTKLRPMTNPAPTSATHSSQPLTAQWGVLAALYLAQGLPSGLFAHALPVFWREAGVSLAWIGALKLLALPWVLKALWAPAIDRSLQRGTPPLRWITRLQLAATGALGLLALIGISMGNLGLAMVVGLVLVINVLMATQDVVTDGLAVRWIPVQWRGLANAIQVAGYKTGMLVGGALLLVLAEQLGFSAALSVPVLLLLLSYGLVAGATQVQRPLAITEPSAPSFREGLTGLLRLPGILPWLALLATYKVADAMGSGMIRPMLTDGGWSKSDIGTFTLVSTLTGIVGAIAGGWLYKLLGSRRSLIYLGLAQAITVAAWAVAAKYGTAPALVYSLGILEQAADGASTVALFAVMMALCRAGWEGTDFTLQASIQVVCAGLFGLLGGVIAQTTSYTFLLVLAGSLGILVVLAFALQARPFHQPPEDDQSRCAQ